MADLNELVAPGHTTCSGCGEILAVRMLLRALGPQTIVCCATGCMEITTSRYPTTSWRIPWIHLTFENAAAVASGVAAALKKKGKKANVVALAGDGGTFDIGFQALSGALERDDNIIYVCTDNEAYMNTGIQRSGATPMYAATTTSPAGKIIPGKRRWKKPIAMIAAAHGIKYVATASVAYPEDLAAKVKKAASYEGARFLHIHSPCPVGWRFDSSKTVEIARKAVQSGVWPLYEIERGTLRMTVKPEKIIPVDEYMKMQKRFAHLKPEHIRNFQQIVEANYKRLLEMDGRRIF